MFGNVKNNGRFLLAPIVLTLLVVVNSPVSWAGEGVKSIHIINLTGVTLSEIGNQLGIELDTAFEQMGYVTGSKLGHILNTQELQYQLKFNHKTITLTEEEQNALAGAVFFKGKKLSLTNRKK